MEEPDLLILMKHIEGAKKFFNKNLNCDLFVCNQGEKGFFNVVEKFVKAKLDVPELKKDSLPGCLVNKLKEQKKVSLEFCNR